MVKVDIGLLKKPTSKKQWRDDYTVLEEWGVKGKYLSTYTIKEGDNIGAWVGGAAKQTGEKTGEIRNGGKTQLFLDSNLFNPRVEVLPNDW